MNIINQRNGQIIADNVEVARSLKSRIIGLIGRRELGRKSALVIPACRQVHTWLMRFPIDLLFCDSDFSIISLAESVKPYSLTGYHRTARYVIQLAEGTVSACDIRLGDVLQVER